MNVDVEQVVREVLAELTRGSKTPPSPACRSGTSGKGAVTRLPSPSGRGAGGEGDGSSSTDLRQNVESRSPHPSPLPEGEGTELVLSTRVVTMSQLDGRLAAIRRLVVPPQAVVTPAVRDELLRRNISLAYGSHGHRKAAGTLRLAIVTVDSPFAPAPLLSALRSEAVEVQAKTGDCLIEATDQLAAEVSQPGTVALLLTRHTAVALCLANRHPGMRAVLGADAPTAAAATEAVGANLLVVDPSAVGLVQLKRMASEFCRGETRPCPEVFRKQLA